MTAPATTRDEGPVLRLVRVVAVVGVAIWLLAAVSWLTGPAVDPWRLALVVALIGIGDAAELGVRLGEHRIRFAPGEAMVILALVAAPAATVLVLAGLVLATAEGLRRTRSFVKASYNVTAATIASAVGAAIVLLNDAAHPYPSAWPALAAAAAGIVLTQGALVSAAVSRATGQPFREVLARGHVQRLALWSANIVVTFMVLAAWTYEKSLLIAVVLLAAFSTSIVTRHVRTRDELDALHRLSSATKTFAGLDEVRVLTDVCNRVCELLGIRSAEILLAASATTPVRRFTLGSGEPGWTDITDRDRADAMATSLGVRPVRGGIVAVAPMHAGASGIGSIRVQLPAPSLSAQEHHLLEALATTAGGAVLNAQMYDAVRRQAEHLTEAAAAEWHQARHDRLTGLSNRTLLIEDGETALAEARARGGRVGLVLIDLNHFKEVNDTLGHAAGDELLRGVADRLRSSTRSTDLLARLGGDEFAVLLPDIDDVATLKRAAETLARRLRAPLTIDGLRLTAEGAFGVACGPDDADSVEGLLRCADIAMYQAKRSHVHVRAYEAGKDEGSTERLAVLAELQAGLGRGELVVHYQPKLDIESGLIVGSEALCRWDHPTRGLLQPGAFVPVVENSSVITELTHAVLGTAVKDAADWRRRGHDVSIAVNVSARNLLDEGLPNRIGGLLDAYGLPGSSLTLEITETLALTEMETVEQVLTRLRGLGVRLSVDDFGTGYSSLRFLQRIDVHEVKIDRSFTMQMEDTQGARAIVEATIDLARRLRLGIVAEGVETAEQLELLRELGCEQAQGYYIGRPMPRESLLEMLDAQGQVTPLAHVIPMQRKDDEIDETDDESDEVSA